MTRRSLLLPVIAVLSILPGCGPGGDAAAPAAAPPQVRTIRIAPEDVVLTTTVVGTLEPSARVVVAAQEEGVVTAVAVRETSRWPPGSPGSSRPPRGRRGR